MLYVALTELAVIVILVSSFAGIVRAMSRSNARREDLLLNQVLHAAGRPWQPAPADERESRPIWDEDGELMVGGLQARFTSSPEQEP